MKQTTHVNPKIVYGNLPIIKILGKIKNPKTRREILRAGEKQHVGQSVCSICKNIATTSTKRITPQQRKTINLLANKRLSRKKRDQYIVKQKGGFFGAILSAVLPLLAGLIPPPK